MKPDGDATTPAEPADVVEPVPEAAANEEQVQQGSSPSSPQREKPENEGEQEGANATHPPSEEINGKFSKPKDKTKAPVKPKFGTAGSKVTTTTNGASRPATASSRVANGVMKAASTGASKKPVNVSAEMTKKSAPVGASAQVKKVPTAATGPSRTLVKAAEKKPAGSARPVPTTSSGMRKTAAASSTLSRKPVTSASNAALKPKSTVPRPTTAPAAKASISTAFKAAPVPKTTRPTVATASRPSASTAPLRPTTTASKSTAARTTPSASVSASSQPSKVSTTVATKKDGKTTTSAAARKPLTSSTTRSAAAKAKPEPTKPGTAAKRYPVDVKTSQPKMDQTRQVQTRKVPTNARNISSRPASGGMAAEFSNRKQVASSNTVSAKCKTVKPKPSEEQSSAPIETSAILETTASVTSVAVAPVESVIEDQTPSGELAQSNQQIDALLEGHSDGVQVPVSDPTNADDVALVTTNAEPLAVQVEANVPVTVTSNTSTVVPESEQIHEHILDMAQETDEREPVTASPCEVLFTAQVSPKDLEVVEKQEQAIRILEDEEEEEREGSQQVSVSDMSGTQPTEESRPGSAGLAGSIWRAGGLPSEFDSEDVSCSQQGASELSAPGVLEGTESMDDLGEASLKGADGEGASAGSPDFEKFPDIPVNEDDDDDDDEDDDRVDDMEVGSEMTEDPHRQCNDNEDEDEDVEMASEGVTESGLESYGNADEDDFAEDYRLDNLNRMQPSCIVPTALTAANPFADAWMQSLQPEPTLVSSSSNPWQTCSELPNQPAAQACLDIGSAEMAVSSAHSSAVMDAGASSPQLFLEPAVEMDLGHKQDVASHSQHVPQSSALLGPELAIHTCSDTSTPEELNGYSISPGPENEMQPLTVSPIPVAFPDMIQDLGVCKSDHAEFEHEEEPKTCILLADDMLTGHSTMAISVPSSHCSVTGDEASDTEGDLQISDPTESGSTGNECFDSTQVVHMSTLVEECEEACVEMEGGGGSDTPQSATSAASYGYECTTSNSNAQSTTESCIKSPGIFSLENEEQLPDETKDPSFIKELNLAPDSGTADADLLDQQSELQLNSEQQYVLCGTVTEELPESCSPRGTVPTETSLASSSSPEHQKDLDLNSTHPYYSTICEKTDSFLTGIDICAQQQGKVPPVHTRSSKHYSGLRVDHVTRLPTDLPPRMPIVGCNAQLRRLEQHQQQLEEIEQRRMQQGRGAESRKEEQGEENHVAVELELKKREEKERELEEQRRHLLQLQIQQQQQELKQRQQIMQWQQELEQQGKHQNGHQKNLTTELLSPSGLCTIYEALETSDAEEEFEGQMGEKEMVLKIKVEHQCPLKERSSIPEAGSDSLDNPDSLQSQSISPSPHVIQDHKELTQSVAIDSPLTGSNSLQQSSPLEIDWSKKADIVQQLINQTLLLNGDSCSPLLLLPSGAAGTLSPLETNLWPNLPPLTPPSATVTSVSSFSAEVSGSSPPGEWTVVELETHH